MQVPEKTGASNTDPSLEVLTSQKRKRAKCRSRPEVRNGWAQGCSNWLTYTKPWAGSQPHSKFIKHSMINTALTCLVLGGQEALLPVVFGRFQRVTQRLASRLSGGEDWKQWRWCVSCCTGAPCGNRLPPDWGWLFGASAQLTPSSLPGRVCWSFTHSRLLLWRQRSHPQLTDHHSVIRAVSFRTWHMKRRWPLQAIPSYQIPSHIHHWRGWGWGQGRKPLKRSEADIRFLSSVVFLHYFWDRVPWDAILAKLAG